MTIGDVTLCMCVILSKQRHHYVLNQHRCNHVTSARSRGQIHLLAVGHAYSCFIMHLKYYRDYIFDSKPNS